MRKTLQDVASYLKEIMVPEAHDAYAIHPAYINISDEETIRESVLAFRAFLVRLYDVLHLRGDVYDTSIKVAHEYENRTTLSVYYPFMHNVSTLLMNIGYHGMPVGSAQSLVCENNVFDKKLSVAKSLEYLRFIADCGICIDGIDIHDKKQNLSDIKTIKITYPDNPAALSIVQDTIRPLSQDVRDFVLQLHHRYLDKGLTCVVEVKGFHIYIKYCYKRKDVWGINASLNNGYHINVKSTKTHQYADTIKIFPPILQELIAKGYGCGRKREIGHCDGGCRGLPIPLNDSVLDMRESIKTLFDQEVSCLQKK